MALEQKRSIVFVNQATGYLTIDIINAFANSELFSKVALIAGSIRVQDFELNPLVEWSRIAPYDRGNPRRKFLSWIGGSLQIGWLLLTRYRKFEVFYITIPPFAYWWALLLSNRFSVLVFDVYPDALTVYDIKETHWAYRLWSRINRTIYRKAHRIYTLGDGMALLLQQYVGQDKITIIPNWSGLSKVDEIARVDNFFIKDHGLLDKFIIQYSGNIGYSHHVEVLVDLAKRMTGYSDVFFLIIGRGDKYQEIKEEVEIEKMINCKVLPFQPDDILNYTLSGTDLGVVLLDERSAHMSIPSKIYNLQAVGVPILGIADARSELNNHLNKHNNGKCFSASETSAIIEYILMVKQDKAKHALLRQNSKNASEDYSMKNAELYLDAYV